MKSLIKNNVVIFSVTNFCNAKCKTCSFWKTKEIVYPAKEDLDQTVDRIRKELNCGFLSITGGEPLTYPHLFHLIKKAKDRHLVVQLMTNGYLLNEKNIAELAKLGLDVISISVDHYDEDKMYANRGLPDLLKKIKKNLVYFKGSGIITSAGITITKDNIDELEKITDFALTDLGFEEVYFSVPVSLENSTYKLGNDESDVINFSNKTIINALERIMLLKKKYGYKISHNTAFLKDLIRYYSDKQQKYPCKAGERMFFLDNYLDVYNCMIDNQKLGNIKTQLSVNETVNCFDCPIQCFREGSMYYYGIKSFPFYFRQLFSKNYWKLLRPY